METVTPAEFVLFCQRWLEANKGKLVSQDDQHACFPIPDGDKAIRVFSSYTSTHLEIIWDG